MAYGRWLVLGFSLGLLVSLAPSCGASQSCGPDSCFGCCNAQGECVAGNSVAVCGLNGAACKTCGATDSCQSGACVAAPQNNNNNNNNSNGDDGGTDAGLPFPTNPLQLTAEITPNPPRLGTNSIKVTVKGSNGTPVADATVTAKTWMPAMGHGSAAPTVSTMGGGDYQLTGVSFTMYGTWTVTVDASASNGILVGSKTFSFTVN